MPTSPGRPHVARGASFLHGVLVLVLIVAFSWLAAHADCAWIASYRDLSPLLALQLALYAALVVVLARLRRRWVAHLVLAAAMFVIGCCLRVQPLGDHGAWARFTANDTLAASALLSSLLIRLPALVAAEPLLPYLPPTIGAVFVYVWTGAAERAFARRGGRGSRVVCGLLPVATPWPLLFGRGFVEVTQLGMVFAVLAVASMVRLDRAPRRSDRALVAAGCWTALAALSHGQSVCLLMAALLALALHHRPGAWARTGQRVLALGLAFSATVAVVVAAVLACDFTILPGHASGGGDDRLFLPIVAGADTPAHVTGLFEPEHLTQFANAMLLAAPLSVAVAVALATRRGRRRMATAVRRPGLVLAALAYVGLLFLLQFDLGFSGDFDLMVSGSVALNLYVLFALTASRPRPLATGAALSAGAAHSLVVMSSLLVPAGSDAPPPLGPAADGSVGVAEDGGPVLRVNGRGGAVRLRPGERILLEVRRPADRRAPARFALLGYVGVPELGATTTTAEVPDLVLCFPPDQHQFLLTSNLAGSKEANRVESHPAPWVGRLPAFPSPLTFQAVIEDAEGRLRSSNAVVVRPATGR